VCAVVNTCEYCHKTTGELEETLQKVLDESHKGQVDLSPVQEEFHTVVTAGMKVLVAALESRIAPHLKSMTKVGWTEIEEIGEDTSQYMQELVACARDLMPQLGESLHSLYVRFFCDKFVASFVPRLIGNIYRCAHAAPQPLARYCRRPGRRCTRLHSPPRHRALSCLCVPLTDTTTIACAPSVRVGAYQLPTHRRGRRAADVCRRRHSQADAPRPAHARPSQRDQRLHASRQRGGAQGGAGARTQRATKAVPSALLPAALPRAAL